MVDGPVDRVERPRDEGVYVSRIQEDKKRQGKYTKEPPQEGRQILLATFFSYLKKVFDNFSPSKQLASKVVDQQKMIENLLYFKKLLERLKNENLSNSPDFATELSDSWCILLEDFDTIEIMERKALSKVAPFREMIDMMKNYPADSEHRFGYYLLQHAGKDWLPFPFIQILNSLHTDYQTEPQSSTLALWFKKIDTAIKQLSSTPPFKPF